MKLFIKLLFFVVAQRLFLESILAQQFENGGGNSSNDNVAILDESAGNFGNDLFGAQLLADPIQTSAVGQQEGENVRFIGHGKINLTVTNGLVFQVCSSCEGSVHICYPSRTTPNSTLNGDCTEPSQCSLQIGGTPRINNMAGFIRFRPGDIPYSKPDSGRKECGEIAINGGASVFKNNVKTLASNIPTCQPKIENDVIQLSIKTARPGDAMTCEVEVVGAKIKYPDIITTRKPPTSPLTPSSTPAPSKDSTAEGSFPVWAIILIIVFLFIILVIGVIVFCWWKQRQSSKSPVPSAFEAPVAVVTRNDAKESTVSTQAQPPPSKQDIKVVKAEPALSQKPEKKKVEKDAPTVSKEPVKKQHFEKKTSTMPEKKVVEKKKTTIEPTTTEKVTPPAQEKNPPPHVVPGSKHSLGSHKTSSVEDRDKLTPVETVADSVSRNIQKAHDNDVIDKMKVNYPQVQRVVLQNEILLFCVAVSQMFSYLNDMAAEYQEILVGYGVHFDGEHKIIAMTSEARQYLQNRNTPGTCALFAFGAEYHEYVNDKMRLMPKLSIPHLMTIALQPRFHDLNRRKACTWIRRELPKIRDNYSVDERKNLPFPIPMIEKAFQHDPKYLLDISGIDTDSEEDRQRMKEAQT